MSAGRDEKEDKAMKTTSNARRAHELLDELDARAELSQEQEKLLRSFLPELPAQMSLEALRHDVHDVWAGVHGNEWPDDMYCDLETWLAELHAQLKGVGVTAPAHPEFLQTGAEYEEAPWGTIVAKENFGIAWVKKDEWWSSTDGERRTDSQFLWGVPRKVLRWGEGA